MNLHRTRRSTLVTAAFALVFAIAPASAQDVKERTIKFATQNPKGHPLVTGMEKFAELVQARSGGKLKVNLYPGGTLGGDAPNVSALQGGTLEMVTLNSGILASQVKDFEVFDLPFLFASPREVDAIVDGAIGRALHAKLADKGIVGLAYFDLGFRHITNSRRPITKVEDIAGLKLRVIPNVINIDWVKALDANPTPLAFPEVYAALEQKAIDGQENPLSVILANKFFEVQKNLVLTSHQYNPQSVIFSKRVWDQLSADEKKILGDAAVEAAKFQRQVSREQAAAALDALKRAGMQVTELAPAELAKFRDKVRPVIERHSTGESAETVKAVQAELAALRR